MATWIGEYDATAQESSASAPTGPKASTQRTNKNPWACCKTPTASQCCTKKRNIENASARAVPSTKPNFVDSWSATTATINGWTLPWANSESWNFRKVRDLVREECERMDGALHAWCRESKDARLLMSIPGIGPLVASCLVAQVGDVKRFPSARSSKSQIPQRFTSWQHRAGLEHLLTTCPL